MESTWRRIEGRNMKEWRRQGRDVTRAQQHGPVISFSHQKRTEEAQQVQQVLHSSIPWFTVDCPSQNSPWRDEEFCCLSQRPQNAEADGEDVPHPAALLLPGPRAACSPLPSGRGHPRELTSSDPPSSHVLSRNGIFCSVGDGRSQEGQRREGGRQEARR